MASIINRSNFIVTVQGASDRTKRFPFNRLKDAQRYQREQQKEQVDKGKAPETVQLTQFEDNLLVRVRDKGFPEHTFKATSYEDAEKQITIMIADRMQGRRIDFNKARTITLAALFDRYIEEVCLSLPRFSGPLSC